MNVSIGAKVFVRSPYGRTPKTLDDELARWSELTVIAENRASWIAQNGHWAHSQIKIDKKTLEARGGGKISWSRDEIVKTWNDAQFKSKHAYNLARLVERASVDQLIAVAGILGHDLEKP